MPWIRIINPKSMFDYFRVFSQIFQDAVSMDSNQDNRALTRADSNHSVNSTVSQDSRDHKIPRSSKLKSLKFKIKLKIGITYP